MSAEADPLALRVYPDGSYEGTHAGWGWVAVRGLPGREERVMERFGPVVCDPQDTRWTGCSFASNNAGELSAVIDAAEWLASRPPTERKVIMPDSCWAIAVSRGGRSRFHRVAARRARKAVAENSVELGWIRGHSDHFYNDCADSLANLGRAASLRERPLPLPADGLANLGRAAALRERPLLVSHSPSSPGVLPPSGRPPD